MGTLEIGGRKQTKENQRRRWTHDQGEGRTKRLISWKPHEERVSGRSDPTGLLRSVSGKGCKGHGIWLRVRWGRASPDVPWAAEQGTGPWDEPGCWALLLAGGARHF